MLCLKLRVEAFSDDSHRRKLFELCDLAKQATNLFWQQWELWHVANGSAAKIRAYLAALEEWRRVKGIGKPKLPRKVPRDAKRYSADLTAHFKRLAAGKESSEPPPPAGMAADLVLDMRSYARAVVEHSADKPKLEVNAMPPELSNLIYHRMAADVPGLSSRSRTLLQNRLNGLVGNLKSARGSLPGWFAILLYHQGRPASIHPVPVPFDAANCRVWVDAENSVRLNFRLERHAVAGQKSGASEPYEVTLKTKGRAARYAQPIYGIARGEAKLAGSSITFNASRRCWEVLIAYEPPAVQPPELDKGKTAVLCAGRKRPWRIRIGGLSRWLGDQGRHIANRREAVIEGRWSRQENYRTATRNRKGHGVRTALVNVLRLEKSWRNFCKTYNETLATEALKRCVELRCGRLVLLSPRRARFLDTAGKNPYRTDSSSWPWYQFAAFLRRKCAVLGIELVEQSQRVASRAEEERLR